MDADLKKIYQGNFEQLYLALSKLNRAQGNAVKAYEHYKLYVAYKDSNASEDKAKRLQQVKMQYEYDKRQAINKAEQDKKDENTKRTRNLQYTAIGIFLIAVIFLYIYSRQK